MTPIKYNVVDGLLRVEVDTPPADNFFIISSALIEHVLTLEINKFTGALIAFELNIVPWDQDWWINSEDRASIEYAEQRDNLIINFTDGSGGSRSTTNVPVDATPWYEDRFVSDMIWKDDDSMIALNRNGVGNLVAIEILGISGILQKYS